MNNHIIAYARHQIITTASLRDLRDCRRFAMRNGDQNAADTFMAEIKRRMVP